MATPVEFKYAPMFQLGEDKTEYRLLTKDGVTTAEFEGNEIIKVSREALTLLAQQAFHDVEFMLRREHNEQVAAILQDPEASENDKYVALQFLRNAEVACKGILPFCQDTGTAIIHGEKGQQVWTGFEDEEALSRGVYNTFTQDNLRYSQNAPLTMYDEVNTRCNLPAQIDIEATQGAEYRFVMVAKGGGSANKTYFYPMTKATIQNEATLLPFLVEKMKSLGTAACPPYHIAFVIGGTSAEKNLLTVKLASIKYYDSATRRDGLSETSNWNGNCSTRPTRSDWAHSSVARRSPTTFVWCDCRVTVPAVLSAWGSAVLPTATSRLRSTATASGWRGWTRTPLSSYPKSCAGRAKALRALTLTWTRASMPCARCCLSIRFLHAST